MSERLVGVEKEIGQHWAMRRDGMAAEVSVALADAAAEVGRAAQEAVASAKRDLADNLQVSLERWLETVAASSVQVGGATDQAVQTLVRNERAITDRLDAFEAAVSARSEAVTEQLTSQSLALRSVLEAMEGVLARQGRDLIEALEGSAAGLNNTFAARLSETEARLLAEREAHERVYASHARLMDETAGERAASLQHVAEVHRASVAADLASALCDLQAQLGAHEHAASAGLTEAARQMADALTVELTGLADALGARGETLRDQIAARQAELIEAIEQGVAKTEAGLSHSLTATADKVSGLAAEIDKGLEQRAEAIAQAMEQASALVLRTLADTVNEAQSGIRRGADAAVHAMDASKRDVLDAVNRGVEDVAGSLNAGASLNLQLLATHVGQAGDILSAAETSAGDSASRLLERARALIETGALEAEKAVDLGRERLLAALGESARAGGEDLIQRGLDSQKALDHEAAKAIDRLEATRAALAGVAAQSADGMAARLTQQMAELQRAIAAGAEQLRREFSGPLAETLARVEAEGVELAGATRVLAESFAATSSAHREQLHGVFAREADALAATVASNAEAFRRDFEAALSGADHAFVARGLDLARTLAARVAEMRALLVDDGMPLLKALDARSGDLSSQIEAASQRSLGDFERKAAGLIALLTRRGDDLLSAMTAAASESARKVADLKSEVDAGAARADASLREVERKAGTVLGLIDRRAADLSTASLEWAHVGSENRAAAS